MPELNDADLNRRLRSHRARTATSSAIRDLLEQARRPGMISLAGGIPDPARFPLDHLAPLVERIVREQGRSVLQYGLTAGEPGVREVLARTIHAELDPEHVVVTTGSQQGLDLLARVTVDPGDAVVVGDPDYLGALQVFRSYGADLAPIPVDGDGLQVDVLADRLAAGLRPTMCYVVVHFHNPTGATLSAERRAQLHQLAEQYGFLVVEDDPYRELYYDDNAPEGPPPGADNLVQLRSVSKILTPGLRLGWMTGPPW
ncbi:MAG: PLP-dependent aminotransferase family protein, partial [Acidimicrobiales bacterium]|nr:PLP-dependent aminotransferase family protein [Acidimicrobiales bacterium]